MKGNVKEINAIFESVPTYYQMKKKMYFAVGRMEIKLSNCGLILRYQSSNGSKYIVLVNSKRQYQDELYNIKRKMIKD